MEGAVKEATNDIKQKSADIASTVASTVLNGIEKVGHFAVDLKDSSIQTTKNVMNKTLEIAENLKDKAGQMSSNVANAASEGFASAK